MPFTTIVYPVADTSGITNSQRLLRYLIELRQPNGWPAIGAKQLIEEMCDDLWEDQLAEPPTIWGWAYYAGLDSSGEHRFGSKVWTAYSQLIGKIPLVAFESQKALWPEWLWVEPAPRWAVPSGFFPELKFRMVRVDVPVRRSA